MPTSSLGGGVALNAASAPNKQTETSRELDVLAREVEQLHHNINQLAERLSPITTPLTQSESDSEKRIVPSTSLAASLRQQSDKVAFASLAIRNLLSRIEL